MGVVPGGRVGRSGAEPIAGNFDPSASGRVSAPVRSFWHSDWPEMPFRLTQLRDDTSVHTL